MAETCILTGILCDPTGMPFGGAKLVIRLASTQPTVTAEMIVAPVAVSGVETAEDGAVTLTLAPGLYRGSATQGAGGRSFNFDLAVPNLETAPLADYIGRIDVEVQTSAQLARDQALAAQQAAALERADAQAARTQAQQAAAAVQPYANRTAAEAAVVPETVQTISLMQDGVRYDYIAEPAAVTPALQSAAGRKWMPAGVIAAVEQFKDTMSWVELGQALQWSLTNGRRITSRGAYALHGGIALDLNGPQLWDFTGARFAAAEGFPGGTRMFDITPGSGSGHACRWIGGTYDSSFMPRSGATGGANEAINIGLGSSHNAILIDHEEWTSGTAFCHVRRDSANRLIGGDAHLMLVAARGRVNVGLARAALDVSVYASAPASAAQDRYAGLFVTGLFQKCKNAVNPKRGYKGFSCDIIIEDCQGGVGFGSAEVGGEGGTVMGGSCGIIRVTALRSEESIQNRLGDGAIIDVTAEDIGCAIAESSPGAGDGYTSVQATGLRLAGSSYNTGRLIARGVNPLCQAHPNYATNRGSFRGIEYEDGSGVASVHNTVHAAVYNMGRSVHEQDGGDHNKTFLRQSGITEGNVLVGANSRIITLGSDQANSGTSSLPGMAFGSDPDTGFSRPGANQISIDTGGISRALITPSDMTINLPVSVAGDLVVSNGNIRTTKVNNAGSTPATVEVRDGDASTFIGQIIGRLAWISNVGGVEQRAAYIEARARNTTARSSLFFSAGQADALADLMELSDDRIRFMTSGALRLEIGTSRIDATLPLGLPEFTVATLPAAAAYPRALVVVTDAAGPTYRAIVAGGGAVTVILQSDAVNWRCH